jgi:hypothetical protein
MNMKKEEMTKEELIEMYRFCLKNGWVHNTPEDSVWGEFTDRNNCFKSYLKNIPEKGEIHILIGEAPPYYPNKQIPIKVNRKYFYATDQSCKTPYFQEPFKHFVNSDNEDWHLKKKPTYLQNMAEKGVLIIDIFPFPIYQSTKIREQINKEENTSFPEDTLSNISEFNKYLNYYFLPRLSSLLNQLGKRTFKYYLFAPKLTSIQFLYWASNNDEIKEKLVNFDNITFESKAKWLNKSLEDFIQKIAVTDVDKKSLVNLINNHPIFMNGSGQPSFNDFINGKKST